MVDSNKFLNSEDHQDEKTLWSEKESDIFLQFGMYLTPDKFEVFQYMTALVNGIKTKNHTKKILDLCSGGGDLAKMILASDEKNHMLLYDISDEMLKRSKRHLNAFENRFELNKFNIFDPHWYKNLSALDCVVSSLGIHHLNETEKQHLFKVIYDQLNPGGRFIIFDLVMPLTDQAWQIYQKQWQLKINRQLAENQIEAPENLNDWNYYSDKEYALSDPIDKPSPLYDQLKYLEIAGFYNIEVHHFYAGHALFSAQKKSDFIEFG